MKLRLECGMFIGGEYNYSMACRIAGYVRSLAACDCFVVSDHDGRAMSEVVRDNLLADAAALEIAKELIK